MGKSTRDAFDLHAKEFARQPNSVRNYYYQEIDRLKNNPERLKKLGIKLENHQKNQFSCFTEDEKNKIIDKIQEKLKQGYSVRKACLLLSGGDVKQMLRLQNKFRTIEASKKNVLMFKKRPTNKITDEDINGLFLGLVKMVKKNAIEQAKEWSLQQREEGLKQLRQTLMQLEKSQRELEYLKTEFEEMKKENNLLKKKLLITTCYKAQNLNKKDKEA